MHDNIYIYLLRFIFDLISAEQVLDLFQVQAQPNPAQHHCNALLSICPTWTMSEWMQHVGITMGNPGVTPSLPVPIPTVRSGVNLHLITPRQRQHQCHQAPQHVQRCHLLAPTSPSFIAH
jgi:hypothetical protein